MLESPNHVNNVINIVDKIHYESKIHDSIIRINIQINNQLTSFFLADFFLITCIVGIATQIRVISGNTMMFVSLLKVVVARIILESSFVMYFANATRHGYAYTGFIIFFPNLFAGKLMVQSSNSNVKISRIN